MHLAPDRLAAHLAEGKLRSLYTLHGDEALLVNEAADAIRAAARAQGYGERSVHTVQGAHFDWSAVLAAAGSMSLFADKQLIEIRIPSGKPGKDGGAALQHLAQDVANAPGNDGVLTLVLLPRLDKQTKSGAWFAALDGAGATLQINPIERAALPQWIAQRLQAQGQRVQPGEAGQHALAFFADRVEGNLLAAHQEITKLGLLYPAGELSGEQIEAAVLNVARYDVFKLSEAVLGGQRARVQRMLDGLRAEGEAEVLVHYTLAEDIRALKRVKDATTAGRPLPVALREQRIWGLRERLFERALPRLTDPQLANLLHAAHQVDGIVKGLKHPGWPQEPWQALHRLAQRLCGDCAGRVAKTPEQTGVASRCVTTTPGAGCGSLLRRGRGGRGGFGFCWKRPVACRAFFRACRGGGRLSGWRPGPGGPGGWWCWRCFCRVRCRCWRWGCCAVRLIPPAGPSPRCAGRCGRLALCWRA
jgi:DNA polymerase-3 subunit delta